MAGGVFPFFLQVGCPVHILLGRFLNLLRRRVDGIFKAQKLPQTYIPAFSSKDFKKSVSICTVFIGAGQTDAGWKASCQREGSGKWIQNGSQ